ncbi:unnamed protein product [Moneuplotes crassus]|uniref:Uncharacterized protein n=1 Tax=Euplotes crassus TaxID=5936 RepID=A0AAD1Y2S3_EUPCR|nr:unnamed protein product [Moneuplotes crassus]
MTSLCPSEDKGEGKRLLMVKQNTDYLIARQLSGEMESTIFKIQPGSRASNYDITSRRSSEVIRNPSDSNKLLYFGGNFQDNQQCNEDKGFQVISPIGEHITDEDESSRFASNFGTSKKNRKGVPTFCDAVENQDLRKQSSADDSPMPFALAINNDDMQDNQSYLKKKTSDFMGKQESLSESSSFNNSSESDETEEAEDFANSVNYNINVQSSKGTNISKEKIVPISKIKMFKRSQTKISKPGKSSLEKKDIVGILKKTARNRTNNDNNSTIKSQKKSIFLNTRELKSRGSTDNGIIVHQVGSFASNHKLKSIKPKKPKPCYGNSVNLFKVARDLHKSMDEHLKTRGSASNLHPRNELINHGKKELLKIIKKHRWGSNSALRRSRVNTSVNLLKLAKDVSTGSIQNIKMNLNRSMPRLIMKQGSSEIKTKRSKPIVNSGLRNVNTPQHISYAANTPLKSRLMNSRKYSSKFSEFCKFQDHQNMASRMIDEESKGTGEQSYCPKRNYSSIALDHPLGYGWDRDIPEYGDDDQTLEISVNASTYLGFDTHKARETYQNRLNGPIMHDTWKGLNPNRFVSAFQDQVVHNNQTNISNSTIINEGNGALKENDLESDIICTEKLPISLENSNNHHDHLYYAGKPPKNSLKKISSEQIPSSGSIFKITQIQTPKDL